MSMPYLVPMNAPLNGLTGGGWDIFGKQAKEKRKLKLGQQAQTFEEKMTLNRYEQERAAIETFRSKISTKMEEVEQAALEGTSAMERARKLSRNGLLEGDPILDEFSDRVGVLETAIVQVQTGTVIDTATFDTNRLAISYSDAQAALIAMRSITNRAVELQEILKERLREIEIEEARAEELRAERAVLAQREAKRQAEFLREKEISDRIENEKRQRASRENTNRELRRVTDELRRERDSLQKVQRRIEEELKRQGEDQARRADREAKLASVRSMRRGLAS